MGGGRGDPDMATVPGGIREHRHLYGASVPGWEYGDRDRAVSPGRGRGDTASAQPSLSRGGLSPTSQPGLTERPPLPALESTRGENGILGFLIAKKRGGISAPGPLPILWKMGFPPPPPKTPPLTKGTFHPKIAPLSPPKIPLPAKPVPRTAPFCPGAAENSASPPEAARCWGASGGFYGRGGPRSHSSARSRTESRCGSALLRS